MLNHLIHVHLFATSWTVARQAPLSMGFSRQEHWSRLPSPPPRDLPGPGTEPMCLASPALAGRLFSTAPPGKPQISYNIPLRQNLTPFTSVKAQRGEEAGVGTPEACRV